MPIYDVALSFAGEQRDYVESVAFALRGAGIRLFYDKFETSRLWGRNLATELDRIYRKESRCVVLFVSVAYRDKKWCRHEFRSAITTAIDEREDYVLPIRFDKTDLDGLPPSIAYLDATKTPPEEVAGLLIEKLACAPRDQTPLNYGETELNVWQIAHPTPNSPGHFSGLGPTLTGGRWNHPGTPVVYAASTLCVAALESTGHPSDFPIHRVAVCAKIALTSPPTILHPDQLPTDWRAMPPSDSTKAFGSRWLDACESAVLSVPSVRLPAERIFLLNPAHPDFASLTVFSEEPLWF